MEDPTKPGGNEGKVHTDVVNGRPSMNIFQAGHYHDGRMKVLTQKMTLVMVWSRQGMDSSGLALAI